jgi:hypothetical protein
VKLEPHCKGLPVPDKVVPEESRGHASCPARLIKERVVRLEQPIKGRFVEAGRESGAGRGISLAEAVGLGRDTTLSKGRPISTVIASGRRLR